MNTNWSKQQCYSFFDEYHHSCSCSKRSCKYDACKILNEFVPCLLFMYTRESIITIFNIQKKTYPKLSISFFAKIKVFIILLSFFHSLDILQLRHRNFVFNTAYRHFKPPEARFPCTEFCCKRDTSYANSLPSGNTSIFSQ